MTDISRLADVAEIIGALIVIGGVFFAVMQMRQIRQQRREMAAIELFRFFGSPQFSQAFHRVLQLPDGLGKEQLGRRDGDMETCAMVISTTMENIGVMVYHRIVPSAVVNDLLGSSSMILWRKLHVWIEEIRDELDNQATFEWFQWLAGVLQDMGGESDAPAYVSKKDWQPGRHTDTI